jgi:hypothetical protein
MSHTPLLQLFHGLDNHEKVCLLKWYTLNGFQPIEDHPNPKILLQFQKTGWIFSVLNPTEKASF